jgi:hypothetical protein
VRVHADIAGTQIGIGNVMIFVNQVDGGMAAGREELHTRAKPRGRVQLSSTEQLAVEIKETASACEKWLETAVAEEIRL